MEPDADIVSLDPKHRSEDVVDYHFGDLSPEARAEFENHLATCPGCQKAVKTAGILFPAVKQALAVGPRVAELVGKLTHPDTSQPAAPPAPKAKP